MGIKDQPVNNVVWRKRDELRANNYNPNNVAPPELKLLKLSILDDGWTQPLVISGDEIVDGFHRWLVSDDKEIRKLTGGKVPTVELSLNGDKSRQMMSTIRHNRARGVHGVLPMSEIVAFLRDDAGLSSEEIEERLGMEWEEVDRLYDKGDMLRRGAHGKFNAGWIPDGDTA